EAKSNKPRRGRHTEAIQWLAPLAELCRRSATLQDGGQSISVSATPQNAVDLDPGPQRVRRMIANQACGPPALNESLNSGTISKRAGWRDSNVHPLANAVSSSPRETLRGPNPSGSASLKHCRNSLAPAFITWASPLT